MASLYSLDCLARFAPQLFGRALSLDGVMGCLVASSGRSDHIDSHTHEMRAALEALTLLEGLARSGPDGLLVARVISFAHVVCGDEARAQEDTWLSLGLLLKPRKKKAYLRVGATERTRYITVGLACYTQARAVWARL